MLQNILLLYLPTILSFVVFVYALIKLVKQGNQFYNRQILCATGVYLLAQIYSNVVKDVGFKLSTDFSIKYIGLIASFLFILTAETGVLDKLMDDGSKGLKKYRRIAFYAPSLFTLIIGVVIVIVLLMSNRSRGLLIGLLIVTYAPAIPGIYYLFKHAIMPTNGIPFLKKAKIVETVLFFAYIFSPTYYLFLTLGFSIIAKVVNVIVLFLFTSALFITTREVK